MLLFAVKNDDGVTANREKVLKLFTETKAHIEIVWDCILKLLIRTV